MTAQRMFIGHYAVGLASKKLAPRASLGVLIAAPILLDLLWPIFLLLGWEHVSIEPNRNPFLRLVFDSYPISHGRVFGLGLWNHRVATIVVELAMFAIAIWIYQRETKATDKIGLYAFWAFLIFLLAVY